MVDNPYESIAERIVRQYQATVTHLDNRHGVKIELEPIAAHVIFEQPVRLLSPVQQMQIADEIAANIAGKLRELIFERGVAMPINLDPVKRERHGKIKPASDPSN